jgi:hypothetical protein
VPVWVVFSPFLFHIVSKQCPSWHPSVPIPSNRELLMPHFKTKKCCSIFHILRQPKSINTS